jgi:hypothetical protein
MDKIPTLKERAAELGLEVSDDPIQVGDTYLAERNTGPHLLTCKSVNDRGWIAATDTMVYPYDLRDCIKVIGEVKS